jgi:signal transduction histidine kinase/PAS domain-containing protein
MPSAESELALLQIPRLAALATSAWPAWLWSTDASRILWANAAGTAIFGTAPIAGIGQRRSDAGDLSNAQIAIAQIPRLAATLPPGGQERLERLRGFGARFGGALMCACARLTMPDSTPAILIAATEPTGPSLTLAERLRRLLPDGPEALAAFASDGALLFANSIALPRLGGAATLSALGLQALAAEAFSDGQASGVLHLGQTAFDVTLTRLGKNETRVLVLALLQPQPNAGLANAGLANAAATPGSQTPSAAETMIATSGTTIAAEPTQTSAPQGREPAEERRHPLRFVWQMDAEGRFVVGSDEFIELVGSRTSTACGRLWSEIAAELKLDPDNEISRAVATRETWSSIPISWPVDETGERLPVELSALPVFDRDRIFRGYRGFGVCRDIGRLNQLVRARRVRPLGFTPAPAPATPDGGDDAAAAQNAAGAVTPVTTPEPSPASERAEPAPEPALPSVRPPAAEVAAAGNVVLFRSSAGESKVPSLSPVERSAFRELAQELTARLNGIQEEPSVLGSEPYAAGELSSPTALAAAVTQVVADIPPIAPVVAAEVLSPAPTHQPALPEHPLLDRVPVGILIYRSEALLYANRYFLELSGYDDIGALAAAGGLNALFAEPRTDALADGVSTKKLSITMQSGDKLPVEGRLFTVPWDGASALALILTEAQTEDRERTTQAALDAAQNEIRDLKANFDRIARREAQKAAASKADFLAKVSHEIRTPLNSMIGFAEVIMAERFGAIGNERYREYLKDMHAAGTHIVSMLNDLLDLSKIETGQLDLTFADVDLNDLTQQCVSVMQPQANRARIIIRTALTPGLLQVMADTRSLRQIVINLLANAIKFTGPGGQVIVSTAVGDAGEAVLRVRDTGVGMRETDMEAVLNPFRQSAASTSWGSGEIGLGLPLTKALVEANRALFNIKSAPNSGTLIEIAFPRGRLGAL